jgi:hypothetical protein
MGLVGLKIGYKPANEKEIPKIVSDLEE